jgi:peptide chain release factor
MTTAFLCITSGRGPAECRQAVELAARELEQEARTLGLSVDSDFGQLKNGSVIMSINGDRADSFAQSWIGTLQWVAQSSKRQGVARKNWFIAIRHMSAPLQVPELTELRFETLRAGGPGGQHQNKTESAVRVTHVPSGLSVVARDARSQHANKSAAVRRLKQLAAAVAERNQSRAAAEDWLGKIDIERGNPRRIYVGEDFRRRS